MSVPLPVVKKTPLWGLIVVLLRSGEGGVEPPLLWNVFATEQECWEHSSPSHVPTKSQFLSLCREVEDEQPVKRAAP